MAVRAWSTVNGAFTRTSTSSSPDGMVNRMWRHPAPAMRASMASSTRCGAARHVQRTPMRRNCSHRASTRGRCSTKTGSVNTMVSAPNVSTRSSISAVTELTLRNRVLEPAHELAAQNEQLYGQPRMVSTSTAHRRGPRCRKWTGNVPLYAWGGRRTRAGRGSASRSSGAGRGASTTTCPPARYASPAMPEGARPWSTARQSSAKVSSGSPVSAASNDGNWRSVDSGRAVACGPHATVSAPGQCAFTAWATACAAGAAGVSNSTTAMAGAASATCAPNAWASYPCAAKAKKC